MLFLPFFLRCGEQALPEGLPGEYQPAHAVLGSDYAKKLKTTTDEEYPTKTLLGVLADYFRIAGLFCVVLIVAGCLYLIPTVWNATGLFATNIFRCGSAFSYAVFYDKSVHDDGNIMFYVFFEFDFFG